jgi:NAD(P)-dependent dehydrogenase (short-subunit alcohol dehydrogenase family)
MVRSVQVRLEAQVAIVTGAGTGIGRSTALSFAREGASVVLVARTVSDLEAVAKEIESADGEALAAPTDVSVEEQVQALVQKTLDTFGRIDILVNNAGLYASLAMRPFDQIPLDEWRRVMDVNVASMFLTCKAVVPHMRERGGGRIVNISSGTPFRGVPFLLHYVTGKGAIVAFTRALAKELGNDEILVNCVAPGFTLSQGVEEHPEVVEALRDVSVNARTLKRDQVPDDVVGAVVFLCGPGSTFITGQTMVIDGGQYFH